MLGRFRAIETGRDVESPRGGALFAVTLPVLPSAGPWYSTELIRLGKSPFICVHFPDLWNLLY